MVLTKEINLNWSKAINFIFDAQSKVSNPTDQILSFDCLLILAGYDSIDLIYLKLILVCAVPLFFTIVLIFIFNIIKIIKNINIFDNFINAIVITYFLIQPIVINTCFLIFSCQEIDPNKYFLIHHLL